MQTAVFLDRDNTLIANDGDLGDPEQVRLLDGVAAGCRALREAGYQLVVVSNQGGVARGKFTEDDVDRVHQRIAMMVDEQSGGEGVIDRFYYCPFHPEATVEEYRRDHPWRKPHPGMLLQAASDLDLDLEHSWLIGDQDRDMEAARAVGCRTVLITANGSTGEADHRAPSFPEAVDAVLGRSEGSSSPPPPGANAPPATTQPPASLAPASIESLRTTVHELAEELRAQRSRRVEFTMLRLGAALCQLLVILLAVLALLNLSSANAFLMWISSAALMQLVVVTLLILDQRP